MRELVDGLIIRDDRVWRNFLHDVGYLIRGICIRMGLSDDENDDVAQAFVLKLLERNCKALRELKIDEEKSFFSWAKVVISHAAIDYIRESDVRRDRELKWCKDRWEEVFGLNIADDIETRITIESASKELASSDQTLLWLDYSGLKDAEIALILGVSVQAVQQRLNRMRRKMRVILGEKE